MSPEDKRRLMVVSAFTAGKRIESISKVVNGVVQHWQPNKNPKWDWDLFDYRIKEGEDTIKKYFGFGTEAHLLSATTGCWRSAEEVMFNRIAEFDVQAIICVTIDKHTRRVMNVSFVNKESENVGE